MRCILSRLGIGCAAMFLAGCTTAPRYGPYSQWLNTGYKDARVAPNSFQVTFNGDRQCSQSHTAHFAFLRCAEVTLEQGHAAYKINDFAVGTNTTTRIEDRLGPAGLAPAYATSTYYSVSVAFDCFDRSEGDGFIQALAQANAIREKYKLPPGNYGISKPGTGASPQRPRSAAHSAAE